jgi:hypothetical protein
MRIVWYNPGGRTFPQNNHKSKNLIFSGTGYLQTIKIPFCLFATQLLTNDIFYGLPGVEL